ncbi:hypothetical protein ACJ73_01668 [Blastomyces percursus]|uniref:Uncharacterized protein n=1 Tax=Blastomyces percursus TaxID=1658174 RepID=A0A1J9QEL0_9EURO|nr:hypothetical protein ACJ73_01668 [Blastomyces percursus]
MQAPPASPVISTEPAFISTERHKELDLALSAVEPLDYNPDDPWELPTPPTEAHKAIPWEECEKQWQARIYNVEVDPTFWGCNHHLNLYYKDITDVDHPRHNELQTIDYKCGFHREQQDRAVNDPSDDEYEIEIPDSQEMANTAHPNHGQIHWSFCTVDSCLIHLSGKEDNDYFPRRRYRRVTRTRMERKSFERHGTKQRQDMNETDAFLPDGVDQCLPQIEVLSAVDVDDMRSLPSLDVDSDVWVLPIDVDSDFL